MADEDVVQNDEDETEDDGEEFMGPGEEFRILHAQCEDVGANLKRVAATMQQAGENVSAEVLRMIAGEVVEFLKEVIAATGSHLEAMDDEITSESPAGELSLENAKALYRTLLANNKLWGEVKEQAPTSQHDTIDKIIEMNADSMRLLVELSDEDDLPEMINDEVRQATDGSAPPN